MNCLSEYELTQIKGGGLAIKGAYAVIGGAIVFVIGVISGLIRPYTCSSNK